MARLHNSILHENASYCSPSLAQSSPRLGLSEGWDWATNECVSHSEPHSLSERLSQSQILRDYEQAFSVATGLPFKFQSSDKKRPPTSGSKQGNPFCEHMAETEPGCQMCMEMQCEITKDGQSIETRSAECPAGLTDSAVPVRVGDKILGYLQTGQVALRRLTREDFHRVTEWLRRGGADMDVETLEQSFFATKVMEPKQYEAVLQLLEVFAQHLSLAAEQIATQQVNAEPPMVQRARRFIEENQSEDLTLQGVAQAVNTSTFHFCKMFKRATGMTFTEHLALVRVAQAKRLLANPQRRISEVAYEVGFTSLTHFNRTFRRVTGQSPTVFRGQVCGAKTRRN